MSITASAARKRLLPLIAEVNADQQAVEIGSKNGTAFLVPEGEHRGLLEGGRTAAAGRDTGRCWTASIG